MTNFLSSVDPVLESLLQEQDTQLATTINLIASENIASPAVRQAMASRLTDKYAEGYPGKRYYAGCEVADKVELLAIDRAKNLFGAEHANVQPHCGSSANMAVYMALLNPGDTILAMNLSAGGHLTHGHPVNFSGKLYNIIFYGVDQESYRINYNEVEELARKHKPKLIVAGASSYSRLIDYEKFAQISRSVGALLMVDMAHIAGLIAGGAIPSPVPYADIVTTTTHKTLRGPRGGMILCKQEYADRIDKAVMPGIQGGPFMHLIAAKAVAFHEAAQPEFAYYASEVISQMQIMIRDLHDPEINFISGGSDIHLVVLDLRAMGISGREAERRLREVGIIVNRNCIPFDPASPMVTSGIRIGTPAIASRGLPAKEIAPFILKALRISDPHEQHQLKKEVVELSLQYPSEQASRSVATTKMQSSWLF